jgi:hypothetical protein
MSTNDFHEYNSPYNDVKASDANKSFLATNLCEISWSCRLCYNPDA